MRQQKNLTAIYTMAVYTSSAVAVYTTAINTMAVFTTAVCTVAVYTTAPGKSDNQLQYTLDIDGL